jgi:16S rRNA (guanine527-N7)-methyltransferase
LTSEVLARFPDRVEGWITPPDGPPPSRAEIAWYPMSGPLFRELDVAGTRAPLLLVTTPPMDEWSDADLWPAGCTLFVPFQDPENVGATIRSAAAFGASRVVLLREASHPFHPKCTRAAGPAVLQIPLLHGPSLADLETSGAPLIALATDGPPIDAEPFPETFGLVVGLEGPGLPQRLRTGPRRCIPIEPGVESLNASAATAVALHVWRAARRAGASPSIE